MFSGKLNFSSSPFTFTEAIWTNMETEIEPSSYSKFIAPTDIWFDRQEKNEVGDFLFSTMPPKSTSPESLDSVYSTESNIFENDTSFHMTLESSQSMIISDSSEWSFLDECHLSSSGPNDAYGLCNDDDRNNDIFLNSVMGDVEIPNAKALSKVRTPKTLSIPKIEKNMLQLAESPRTSSEEERSVVLTAENCFVKLRFRTRKEFLCVVKNSGPNMEYKLPIFAELVPLDSMKLKAKYKATTVLNSDPEVEVISTETKNKISIRRYDSRLTLNQLALILGLQEYNLTLVKDVETIILSMFEQLCGFKIGKGSWSRAIPRKERQEMISRVYAFSKIYFSSFTRDIVQIILKRGAYSRTQEFLRRKRRQEKKHHS